MTLTLLIINLFFIIIGCQSSDIVTGSRLLATSAPVAVDKENVRSYHVSTRPHNRKVIFHEPSGYWYIFYGHGDRDPDGKYRISWRSSKDGINWSERHTAFEGNSNSSSLDVLLTGNTITYLIFRPNYYREKAGIAEFRAGKAWHDRPDEDFPLPYEIGQFELNDGDLIKGPIFTAMPGNAFGGRPHYGSLTQDSDGYFWVGARAITSSGVPYQAWVSRSMRANDISEWQRHTVIFEASSVGTITVQVVALDEGKVYAVIFSESDIKVFGSLYDPKTGKWERPYVIAEGNAESKRAVAAFDPGTNRLHLVYIDNSGALRHKILSHPYGGDDWLPKAGNRIPGLIIDSNVVSKIKAGNDISLSADTSKVPARLVVAYQKETPHYRLRWYDGKEWGRGEFQIGIQDSERHTDEISLIREYSDQLGLIYFVTPDLKRKGEIHFLKIPKDVFQDNKN